MHRSVSQAFVFVYTCIQISNNPKKAKQNRTKQKYHYGLGCYFHPPFMNNEFEPQETLIFPLLMQLKDKESRFCTCLALESVLTTKLYHVSKTELNQKKIFLSIRFQRMIDNKNNPHCRKIKQKHKVETRDEKP